MISSFSRSQPRSCHTRLQQRYRLQAISTQAPSSRSSYSRGSSAARSTTLLRPETDGFLRTPWLQGCYAVAVACDGRQDSARTDK